MEEFKIAEVKLNVEAFLVEIELPRLGKFLHILVGFDEQPAVIVVHVALEVFGDIPCVGNDDAVTMLIDLPEDIAVVSIGSGEVEIEYTRRP